MQTRRGFLGWLMTAVASFTGAGMTCNKPLCFYDVFVDKGKWIFHYRMGADPVITGVSFRGKLLPGRTLDDAIAVLHVDFAEGWHMRFSSLQMVSDDGRPTIIWECHGGPI